MFDDFIIRAGLAALGVAVAAGPLGAFVVWRRMAYFGDATAHSAILGVALALAFEFPVSLGTFAVAIGMALLVSRMIAKGQTADASLGVLSHGALAIGLMAFYLWGGSRIGLDSYLFGDILLVQWDEVAGIWVGAVAIVAVLMWRWQALLTVTLNEELAQSAGLNPRRERLVLTLALAVAVAVALKVVGALLIGAMLIIPSAAARNLSRSPEMMALIAVGIGSLSALAGLAASVTWDVPAGPAIVSSALVFYVLALLKR